MFALVPAMIFGQIEQFIFDHGFHPGPANFGPFQSTYHGLMLLLAIFNCCASGLWWALPGWILLEDIFYFADNKNDTRDAQDWVNYQWGGFKIFNIWIPWTYIILFGLFLIGFFMV